MPRVSDQHLAARRDQILDAARKCFLRNGFHATSMQDVINEAGLSVGAIYRYFKSKNEIVTAIAEQVVGLADAELADLANQDPPLSPIELVDRAIRFLDTHLGPDGAIRLAVQVWSEAMRDAALADYVKQVYTRLRGHLVTAVRRAQQHGNLPARVDPEGAGAVLFSLLPGYALQVALTGGPDRERYLAGVRALLAGFDTSTS